MFIDADKPSTPDYFRWAMKLTRKGSVIVVDNVVRSGARSSTRRARTQDIEGMRRFLAQLAEQSGASGTVLQTVGVKGYDGFALIVV